MGDEISGAFVSLGNFSKPDIKPLKTGPNTFSFQNVPRHKSNPHFRGANDMSLNAEGLEVHRL
jgi:hypothetical protein